MLKQVIIAGFGGFIGTILRFLVSRSFQVHVSSLFPWGTFTVNIVGCLFIGIIGGIAERTELLSYEWRIFLTVGICGGFTTFSSYSNEALMLLQNKELLRFSSYTVLSVVTGIASVVIGRNLIKAF
ncbi:MAG TPA: fluoride efflux transporter CrcB [Bacteroidales bacterium]|nr:fluoride efflux transporter CrcB [Bacteroidales bacterium]